jgi:hypothetical protein
LDFEEGSQDQMKIDELKDAPDLCISFREGEDSDLVRLKSLFIKEGTSSS